MKTPFSLVIATQNPHKVEEILAMLPCPATAARGSFDIPETGSSYLENALIKARAWRASYPGAWILADDSGVEADALNGAPGLISADWAGRASPQGALIAKMLQALEGVPFERRGASMVCTVVLLAPNGMIFASRGETRGRIALQAEGDTAFGYDPIFLSADHNYEKSFSQLSQAQKNAVSHRARALKGVADFLQGGAHKSFGQVPPC